MAKIFLPVILGTMALLVVSTWAQNSADLSAKEKFLFPLPWLPLNIPLPKPAVPAGPVVAPVAPAPSCPVVSGCEVQTDCDTATNKCSATAPATAKTTCFWPACTATGLTGGAVKDCKCPA